jgi:hypothetical protein
VRQHGEGPSASAARQITPPFTGIVGFAWRAETLPAPEADGFPSQGVTLPGA